MTTELRPSSAVPPSTAGRLRAAARARAAPALDQPRVVMLVLLGLAGCYLATRLWFINHFPYFYDEGLYANWTLQGANSLHALFVAETIGREPMLPWLAIVLVKLGFGSLTAVRLVSVFAGLATAGVVGLIGRRIGGMATGLVAAGLCVVLPMFVVHDGIGIYEPLVTLIMASALYVQLELARRPRLSTGVLLAVILGAALLTKENTLPAIILIPVSLLCFDWSPEGRGRRLRVWAGAVGIGLLGALCGELLLRSSGYYSSYVAVRNTPWYTVRSLSNVLSHPFNRYTAEAWRVLRDTTVGYFTLPLLAVGIVGAVMAARSRRRLLLVLLAWIAVPLVGALFFTTFPFPRHYMYAMPPLIVLAAYALVQGWRVLSRAFAPRLAIVIGAVAALLLLSPALSFDARVLAHPGTFRYPSLDDWQYVTGEPAGTVWPAVANAIRRRAVGSRVIVLTPNSDPKVVFELLGNNPRYVAEYGTAPDARSAQFIYTEAQGGGFDFNGLEIARTEHFVLVGRYVRPGPCRSPRPLSTPPCPRGGDAILLYARPGLPHTPR